jgi:polar amino acid transport system substrate-binding protein
MASQSKRTFLMACGLAAGMLAWGPATADDAPHSVTLLLGDTLDAQGRQKPLKPSRRKLFDYLEQELNVAFQVKTYPWPRAESNARAGAGLIFGLPKNAERLRDLRYSEPASNNTLWLVTRSDATFPFNTLDDLRGKTIGAVRGYTYGDEFERRRNKLFRVENDIASRSVRLQRLLLKRVDAVLLVQPSGEPAQEVEAELRAFAAPFIKELNLPADVSVSVLPKPVQADSGEYFAIAYDQDNGLIDRINAALARLHHRAAQR